MRAYTLLVSLFECVERLAVSLEKVCNSLRLKLYKPRILALIEAKLVCGKIVKNRKGEIRLRYASIEDVERELGKARLLEEREEFDGLVYRCVKVYEYRDKRIELCCTSPIVDLEYNWVSWGDLIK